MVRESRLRLKKWDKKVDPSVVLQRFTALKDISKEQLDPYLIQVTAIEKRVKELLESKGIPTVQVAFYLAYARELLGKTFGSITEESLRNEELAIRSKWVIRGLEDSKLKEIAKMFGISPKPLPTVQLPFDVIKDFETDEELEDITVTKESSEEEAKLWVSRTNLWAFNGNYCLEVGSEAYPDRIYIEMPFNPIGHKTIEFYVHTLGRVNGADFYIQVHLKTIDYWLDLDVFYGNIDGERVIYCLLDKERVINSGYDWNDIDKIKIRLGYDSGEEFRRNEDEYVLLQVDYIIAKKE